jgi:hypothetical protein
MLGKRPAQAGLLLFFSYSGSATLVRSSFLQAEKRFI